MRRANLLTTIWVGLACATAAQGQGQSQGQPKPPKYERITFQDLPDFTGHSRLVIQHTAKTDFGVNLIQVQRAKETPQQVHDWYDNVFKMNKWRIIHDDPRDIIAEKDGNKCNIQINAGTEVAEPTEFEITYFLNTRKHPQSDVE